MKRLLVTGAGGSASSNFVDALRLAPEPFYLVGADVKPYHLPLTKTDKNYLVPRADDPRYLDVIHRICDEERIDLLHAQPDPEVDVLSRRRDELRVKTCLPAREAISLCGDKMAFRDRLAARGVPVPAGVHVTDEEALAEGLRTLVGNGRPDRAWLRAIRGAGSRASLPVRELEHARAWIDYWRTMKGAGWGDFMLSEFLPGREFAFQSLWQDGRLVVGQARERVEYIFGHLTPSGQSSSPSVARTVARPDVNETALAAVRAVDERATGIFCVDMKEDANGRPRVTEINCGRFFTTSNFFAHAGVNFPHLYVKLALGEPLPGPDELPPLDAVAPNRWWVRMIDMGYRLVEDGAWNAIDWSKG